jgi:hypothetical protein
LLASERQATTVNKQCKKGLTTVKTINIPSESPPWSTVYAVADAKIQDAWMLVGGLMVQLHAIMGGFEARPTTDMDLPVDLMSDRRGVSKIRGALSTHGFIVQPGTLTGYTTRMRTANGSEVDLLVADHLPKSLERSASLDGDPILSMPGGAQAVERSIRVIIADDRKRSMIRIPDLLGALMLKSAAFAADHAGYGERHLYDAAMLASLIDDPDAEKTRLHSRTDRKRTKLLHEQMTENSPYWERLDETHRQNGLDAIEVLAEW